MADTEAEKCVHGKYNPDFKMTWVKVTGLNIQQMVLKVKVTCAKCGKHFIFKGQTGFSTSDPKVSPDGYELRVPLDFPDDASSDDPDDDQLQAPPVLLH